GGLSGVGRRRVRERDLGLALRLAPDDAPSVAMSRETHCATHYPDAEIQSAPPASLCPYTLAHSERLLDDLNTPAPSRARYGSGRRSSSWRERPDWFHGGSNTPRPTDIYP